MRRRKVIIGILALLLCGVLAWMFWPEKEMPEPVYKGKKLSEWIDAGIMTPENYAAVMSIGTNGIPCYLQWIRYEPDIATRAQSWVTEYGRRWLGLKWVPPDPRFIRALSALQELQALGAKAEPAIPLLVASATNRPAWPPSPFSLNKATSSYWGLAQIGQAAVPAFLSLMTNQDPRVRASAVATSVHIRKPSIIAQALTSLHDPDYRVRCEATNVTKRYIPNFGYKPYI